jgi:hypothetical protein
MNTNNGDKVSLLSTNNTLDKFLNLIEENQDKSKDAIIILKEIHKNKILPDVEIYNKLIQMSIRLEQFEVIHKIYDLI